jgi:hypothetical protein
MKRISNREARKYVERREPFQGSNLFAESHSNGVYVVYSYGRHFPLLAYADNQWFQNKDKYSRTTSYHFTQCRPSAPCQLLSTEMMHRVISGGIAELAKARVLEGVQV